jgi:hypothetical protein
VCSFVTVHRGQRAPLSKKKWDTLAYRLTSQQERRGKRKIKKTKTNEEMKGRETKKHMKL